MEELRVPFPTQPGPLTKDGKPTGTPRVGYPDRSEPCDGHPCVVHDSECIWCGHLPGDVIDRTWAERQQAVMAVAS